MNAVERFSSPYSATWTPWVIVGLAFVLLLTFGYRHSPLQQGLRSLFQALTGSLSLCIVTYPIRPFDGWSLAQVSAVTIVVYALTVALVFLINSIFLRRRHFEETFYSYNTIRTIAAVALWLVQVLAINGLAISIVAVLDAIIVAAYWLVISVQLFRETPLGALNLFYILLYLITLEIIPLTGIVLWYKKY